MYLRKFVTLPGDAFHEVSHASVSVQQCRRRSSARKAWSPPTGKLAVRSALRRLSTGVATKFLAFAERMRSFWIFWRRRHKVGQRHGEEDAHELCENDANCDADGRHRRFFLKSGSSGDSPRPAAVRVDSSSSDDDDEEEEDEDEYEDEYEYEDEDEDEDLTCNVCERSFSTARRLSKHQQRKRHFGCPVCDAIFPSPLALENHRGSMEHWSDDDEDDQQESHSRRQHRSWWECDDEDDDLDDEEDEEDEESSEEDTDLDDVESGPNSQELERLL